MTRKLLRLFILFFLFFIPISAFALGMGQIKVHSALNQPLDAEIELLAIAPGDLDNLSIQVSTQSLASSQFGSPVQAARGNFSGSVQTRNGRSYIRLASNTPIREPLLDLLIELNWANGRLVREFAVLLDPPGFARAAEPAAEPEPRPVSRPRVAVRPTTPASPSSTSAPASATVPPPAPAPAPAPVPPERAFRGGDVYGPVARGETLWRIADRMRPENVSIQQMMLALRDKNPRAFLRGNIDSLLAGARLDIPTAEELASYTRLGATELVRQINQTRDTSPDAATEQPAPAPAPPSPPSGRVVLEQPSPSDSSVEGDESEAESAAVAPAFNSRFTIKLAGNNLQLAVAQLNQLRDRIDRLVEAGDLGAVSAASAAGQAADSGEIQESPAPVQPSAAVTPQSESITPAPGSETVIESPPLQQPAAADSEQLPESVAVAPSPELTAETPLQQTVDTTSSPENIAPVAEQPLETLAPESMSPAPDTDVIVEAPQPESALSESDVDTGAAPVDVAQSETPAENGAAAVESPEPAALATDALGQPPQLTLMERLFLMLRDPTMLGLFAAGLLLLIALPILLIRMLRKRRDDDLDEEEEHAPAIAPAREADAVAPSSAAAAAPPAVASARETVQLDKKTISEPQQDPVEQANNLLARGNYKDAEDLVRQARLQDPTNTALMVKMLDIHFASGNKEGFLADAEILRNKLGNESDPSWQQVAFMGRNLFPNNPLFGGAPEPPTVKVAGISGQDEISPASTGDKMTGHQAEDHDDADDAGMEFDFDAFADLGEPVEEKPSQASSQTPPQDNVLDDFERLDWQFSDADAQVGDAEESEASKQGSDFIDSDDFDAQLEGLSFEFDDADTADAAKDEEGDKPTVADAADSNGSDSLAFDDNDFFNADSAVAESAAPDDELSEELEKLDFDLPAVDEEKENDLGNKVTQQISTSSIEDDGDFFASEDYVETKLDLATAYLDMEDPVGARSLLEEVLKEGSPDQQQRAEELMQRLS